MNEVHSFCTSELVHVWFFFVICNCRYWNPRKPSSLPKFFYVRAWLRNYKNQIVSVLKWIGWKLPKNFGPLIDVWFWYTLIYSTYYYWWMGGTRTRYYPIVLLNEGTREVFNLYIVWVHVTVRSRVILNKMIYIQSIQTSVFNNLALVKQLYVVTYKYLVFIFCIF